VLPDVRKGNARPPYEHGPASRSPDSVWWGRVRFVLGMAQMAASVVAVVLLFGVGVTAISLTAVVVASSLTSLSVMLFGSRRHRRDRV
jgi:hypothetical protein